MKYTDSDIRQANDQDIIDVADELGIKMVKRGSGGRLTFASCLWHEGDENPSMQIGGGPSSGSSLKGRSNFNICHCYSCGETHGVIDLVMKVRNCSFVDAMKWIGEKYGLTYETKTMTKTKTKKDILKYGIQAEIGRFSCKGSDPLQNFRPISGSSGSSGSSGLNSLNGVYGQFSSFEKGLGRFFGSDVARRVCQEYYVTGYDNGERPDCTLFPSIDKDGNVLGVKVQWYYGNLKSDKKYTYWKEHQRDCLFGEHLLRQRPEQTVGLVESPKNALVCACYQEIKNEKLKIKNETSLNQLKPSETILWLATGNKGLLKREILAPLHGRRVLVLPDVDAQQEWMEKLDGMKDIATFHLSHLMPEIEKLGEKADIADWIVNNA